MKTFIIAEIGVNHGGNLDIAEQLIDVAVNAGADAVKFQAWREGRFPDIENLRLNKKALSFLKAYAKTQNIEWMCTPFDFESIDFLNDLGMKIWKIPSGMVTNIPYLEKIKSINPEKIILSTGMCDEAEVKTALHDLEGVVSYKDVIMHDGDEMDICIEQTPPKREVVLLHCTTVYPTPPEATNLKVIDTFRKKFGVPVGLSDHTTTIEIPVAAVAMGATVIEKHITLDRNQAGPDHKASLEPQEFKTMVKAIRNVELAMGDGVKRPTESELKVRDAIRERMKLCNTAPNV